MSPRPVRLWPGLGGGRWQVGAEGVLTEPVVHALPLLLPGGQGALAEHAGRLGPAPGPQALQAREVGVAGGESVGSAGHSGVAPHVQSGVLEDSILGIVADGEDVLLLDLLDGALYHIARTELLQLDRLVPSH